MWIVIKYKTKEQNYLLKELKDKIGKDIKICTPKIKFDYFLNNKIKNNKKYLLGDYLLCYHDKFKEKKYLDMISFLRGLKYYLKDFISSQKEIKLFVNRCKNFQNNEGFISQDFFDFKNSKEFKFFSGPFANMVFELIKKENKVKLKCLIGNFRLTLTGKDKLYFPV